MSSRCFERPPAAPLADMRCLLEQTPPRQAPEQVARSPGTNVTTMWHTRVGFGVVRELRGHRHPVVDVGLILGASGGASSKASSSIRSPRRAVGIETQFLLRSPEIARQMARWRGVLKC